jgi:hypothetical protein
MVRMEEVEMVVAVDLILVGHVTVDGYHAYLVHNASNCPPEKGATIYAQVEKVAHVGKEADSYSLTDILCSE